MIAWQKIGRFWEATSAGRRVAVIQRIRNDREAYDCVLYDGDTFVESFRSVGGLVVALAKQQVERRLAELAAGPR